jgi:hypothetical protein
MEADMFRKFTVIGFVPILLLFLSSEATAQDVSTFAELQSLVRTNDKVVMTDTQGMKMKGAIIDISPSLLRIKVQGKTVEWREDEVRRVDKRRPDRWWDWAIIGAGIGAASAYFMAEISSNSDYKGIWVPWGAGIGAATGFSIDLAKHKSDTVFKAPTQTGDYRIRLSPILIKESKGATLSVSF